MGPDTPRIPQGMHHVARSFGGSQPGTTLLVTRVDSHTSRHESVSEVVSAWGGVRRTAHDASGLYKGECSTHSLFFYCLYFFIDGCNIPSSIAVPFLYRWR